MQGTIVYGTFSSDLKRMDLREMLFSEAVRGIQTRPTRLQLHRSDYVSLRERQLWQSVQPEARNVYSAQRTRVSRRRIQILTEIGDTGNELKQGDPLS